MIMSEKIIVTGGCGFIGGHFLDYIHSKTDSEIIVLDKLSYASNINVIPNSSQFKFVWCDISNESHVNYIFNEYKPTKVFHFAAESHVDNSIKNYKPFLESNVIGTINLLNASLKVDLEKFHHVSTDEVYGSLEYDSDELFTEETQIDPRNPYSASKASSDHFVSTWNNTYKLPYLITRCSNNYGPNQHHEKLIPRVITNALKGKKTYMYGGGNQTRDWLHVKDHCAAIWLLDELKVINDIFNIGGDCEKTNLNVTKSILDIMSKPYNLIGVSGEEQSLDDPFYKPLEAPYYRPGQDSRYGTDHSKLTNLTGWKPSVKFEKGLNEVVMEYMKK
tara:strand:- start:3289 stop:4287 length:999 start_codon:yes stop_codon:yes gene_type:complete